MTYDVVGVFRQCWRCSEWLPLPEFGPDHRLCRQCMAVPGKRIGQQSARTIRILPKGRAYLAAGRAAGTV